MEELYCVYKHTTPNGKIYVGITKKTPEERWRGGDGYKYNQHFARAIRKYGWDNIAHEIIASRLTEKDAKEMERFFVYLYDSCNPANGYNKTHGGDDFSINEKKILQYDKSGRFIREYSSITEAAAMTNSNLSRISDCANGKRFTTNGFIWLFEDDEQKDQRLKEKVREKKRPSAMCGGANHQARPIEQYTLGGTYVATYPSAQTAADSTGIDYSTIKASASKNKRSITAGGYFWIDADEPDKQKKIIDAVKRYNNSGCEKPVRQYSLDGEFVAEYSSIKEATMAIGKRSSHIGSVCNGKRNIAYGYKWKFA